MPAPVLGTQPGYVPRAALRRPRSADTSTRARGGTSALASRITPRDLWLLQMLHEHRVLTTHHITALWNVSHRVTNRRLRALYHFHALDSFRPLTRQGSAPEHYTLGRAGAEILAARYGTEISHLGWRTDLATRTAFSPALGHDLAVHTLLVTLAARHHQNPDQALTTWLSPRSAARLWGDWIRPDAYAHWRHHTTEVPFFLEHDTGTEALHRVEAKLAGYAELSASTATATPLLIHTSSAARETHLRRRLGDTAASTGLLVATTHHGLPAHATAGAWLPLHPPTSTRQALDGLATYWPGITPALTDQSVEAAAAATAAGRGAFAWQPIPPLPPAPTRQPPAS
ncbi:replication-relaxation family protein [Streptomyces sp. SBT349]|uniref:replication-relaxation family protein n=1 Tax=Streptomyces sp. SBT349 TaxID=1580539 RepID=UPI0007C72425|nr:replication-relaxation family protein [Streptomyces sp. SBT349]